MPLKVLPAEEAHAHQMAPLLRQADLDEIAARSGSDPLEVLLRGLEGDLCLTAVDEQNVPILMGGVAPSKDDISWYIWLLGTDAISTHQIQFLREGRRYVDRITESYPLLFNYVDARNTVHIRWLKWLGFMFIQRHPFFGIAKIPFFEFVRTSPNV